MKADGSYDDIIKNEDWLVKGPIKRIELTNFGTGYTSANLPTITITTTTGSSANLIATNIQGNSANVTVDTSNNITGIGSIRAVQITNFGINYSTANAIANTVGDGNANLTATISGLGIKDGVWVGDDGKIDYKIIQDSYYYQDYSYVIKSGLAFETYSDTLKSIIHPAGLIYFGEIQILNDMNAADASIENRTFVVQVPLESDAGILPIPMATIKRLTSGANEIKAYGVTYEDIPLFSTGVLGDDWINTPISTLENVAFSDPYYETPGYQSVYSIIDKFPHVDNLGISLLNQEYSVKISSLGFMSYTTESVITTSSTSIDTVYLENVIDNSSSVANTSYVSYVPISGTVSSAVQDYSTYTLAAFENVAINAIDSVVISATAPVVVGVGTNFVADFNGGDIFVANNEYFIIQAVFGTTNMVIDRSPATPFTNVVAYKINP